MSFVTPEILAKLGKLSRSEADRADFGIIQVDPAGRILLCNAYAARHLGKTGAELEGKNFFLHAAPCSRNKCFQGRFENGIGAGELNVGFNYAWITEERSFLCAVHLLRDRISKTQWIFFQPIQKAAGTEDEIRASMEEQLLALYQDRTGREVMALSQEAPTVPAEELEALRREKEVLAAELKAIKTKARDIGAAMFEAALFGKEPRRRAAGE